MILQYCLLVEVIFLTVHAEARCDNLPKLHDFTLHCLLVEATFLIVHAEARCDNLPKLHDFTLHRLLPSVHCW